MKKIKVLAAAATVLALLIGVFFLVSWRAKVREKEQQVRYDTLFDLTAEKISRIAWKTADGKEYAFARKDSTWTYEFDDAFAVNQDAVNLLSSGMTGVSVYQTMEKVTDLAQYGLDTPAYTVSVTDRDGKTVTALIGNNNETAGSVYAMYENDPATVLSVQPSIKSALGKTLGDFEQVSDSSVSADSES